jgi:two-component system, OmpR family, sensor histidine kinase VicK
MKGSNPNSDAAVLAQVAAMANQVYFIYEISKHKIRYLNAAVELLCQFPRETLMEDPVKLFSMVHPDDQTLLEEQYQALLTGIEQNRSSKEEQAGAINSLEFRLRMPDDSMKWICLTAYLIRKGRQSLISGYAEDITERKEYLEATLKFNAKKNAILEILSHDLAAPFATIQGMSNLVEQKLKKGESIDEFITYIKQSARKGSDLIRDFVDAEFLESSHVVLHKERTDLVGIFRTTLEDYQRGGELIAKQFILSSTSPSVYLVLDSLKFLQVINNLISNAIKFTQDDGTIEVRIEDKEKSVQFYVADNGIGIPQELQPMVFDKFSKARRPGIRGEKSTGLGMSIIKTIIELHQGKIWFTSEKGKGTTFYVELPKGQV